MAPTLLRLPARLRGLLRLLPPGSRIVADSCELLRLLRYRHVVAVGDYVTRLLRWLGVEPWVMVYDCATMRSETVCPWKEDVTVRNPASTLSLEAWQVVCSAVRRGEPKRIRVEGEEDLLALAAIMCCPQGCVVVYGYPGVGSIVAEVNAELKRLVRYVLSEMARCPEGPKS